jgi:hypothetical protein
VLSNGIRAIFLCHGDKTSIATFGMVFRQLLSIALLQ